MNERRYTGNLQERRAAICILNHEDKSIAMERRGPLDYLTRLIYLQSAVRIDAFAPCALAAGMSDAVRLKID